MYIQQYIQGCAVLAIFLRKSTNTVTVFNNTKVQNETGCTTIQTSLKKNATRVCRLLQRGNAECTSLAGDTESICSAFNNSIFINNIP